MRPHPNKLALPQKGHIPHKENTARSNEIGERSLSPLFWRETQSTKTTFPRKRKDKKRFVPDSQGYIQPNWRIRLAFCLDRHIQCGTYFKSKKTFIESE